MANKIFEGVDLVKVESDDPVYSRLAGEWGLKDKRSGKWIPGCFTHNVANGTILMEDAVDTLSAPLDQIIHLHSYPWGFDSDNYYPSIFLHNWIKVNPGVMEIFFQKQEDRRKAQAKRRALAKKGKRGRGRPPKNFIVNSGDGISDVSDAPRKRGRPKKNVTNAISMTAPTMIVLGDKRKRGRPAKVAVPKKTYTVETVETVKDPIDVVKKKRGRPPKNQAPVIPVIPAIPVIPTEVPLIKKKRGRPPKTI